MPQLDLESRFCVGAGAGESRSKVACETIAVPNSDASGLCNINVINANDADGRAESRRTSWAWSGLAGAGAVLKRDGSTKGSSNPKAAADGTSKGAPKPRRPPPAVVIGVRKMAVHVQQRRRSPVLGRGWRRPAGGARVFASEAVETEEPSSPRVSCFGAVRSESRAAAAPALRSGEEEQSGCWTSVIAALRDMYRSDRDSRREVELPSSEPKATELQSPTATTLSPPRPVPGLGDVKRLASRRWPDGVAGDVRCKV